MMLLMMTSCIFFFFNDTATTEIYTLSLHDALPIYAGTPLAAHLFLQPCVAELRAQSLVRGARQCRRRAAGIPPPRPHERARGAGQVSSGSRETGGVAMAAPLYESSIRSLPFLGRGKVRDMYAVGDDRLLIVTTDRLSAFDVVLPDPIPGKGE